MRRLCRSLMVVALWGPSKPTHHKFTRASEGNESNRLGPVVATTKSVAMPGNGVGTIAIIIQPNPIKLLVEGSFKSFGDHRKRMIGAEVGRVHVRDKAWDRDDFVVHRAFHGLPGNLVTQLCEHPVAATEPGRLKEHR